MRDKLERTTEKEREILKNRVLELIKTRQTSMDSDAKMFKGEYICVRGVKKWKYNVSNIFKEMKIFHLLPSFYNAISDRENYHTKNESYYELLKAFGL